MRMREVVVWLGGDPTRATTHNTRILDGGNFKKSLSLHGDKPYLNYATAASAGMLKLSRTSPHRGECLVSRGPSTPQACAMAKNARGKGRESSTRLRPSPPWGSHPPRGRSACTGLPGQAWSGGPWSHPLTPGRPGVALAAAAMAITRWGNGIESEKTC